MAAPATGQPPARTAYRRGLEVGAVTLPVLDKESYRHACSDWVMAAGRALRREGYLRSEPTGTYDEEFGTALRTFQAERGIYEEDRVGPETWTALGVAAVTKGASGGQLSKDGLWRQWDDGEWMPAESAPEHVLRRRGPVRRRDLVARAQPGQHPHR